MNNRTAKLIRKLAKAAGRTQRSLKKEYYKLGDKDRQQMREEMERFEKEPDLLIDESKGIEEAIQEASEKIMEGQSEAPVRAVGPAEYALLKELHKQNESDL